MVCLFLYYRVIYSGILYFTMILRSGGTKKSAGKPEFSFPAEKKRAEKSIGTHRFSVEQVLPSRHKNRTAGMVCGRRPAARQLEFACRQFRQTFQTTGIGFLDFCGNSSAGSPFVEFIFGNAQRPFLCKFTGRQGCLITVPGITVNHCLMISAVRTSVSLPAL